MSEQDLVNTIIQLIQIKGGVATRINSGMQVIYDQGSKRVIRGAPAGTSDIIACYRGRYIAIECKVGKNKSTDLQELFLEKVSEAGGMAIVAYTIDFVKQSLEGLEQ